MLYLIGLGIHDEKDLSIKALEILRRVDRIYAELYTSFFNGDLGAIENLLGKEISILRRVDLEEHIKDNVLSDSVDNDVALLVCGDPLIATTHSDIVLRAYEVGVAVKVIHSSSIYSAIAETGLHIYKFGKTTTLPFPDRGYLPTSPYDTVKENLASGLHTLLLLDVWAEEDRCMTVKEGLEVLLEMERIKGGNKALKKMLLLGVARLGGDSVIKAATPEELMQIDFGRPPHSIIVPADMHFMEEKMLRLFR